MGWFGSIPLRLQDAGRSRPIADDTATRSGWETDGFEGEATEHHYL
jgi:hypothetical protein